MKNTVVVILVAIVLAFSGCASSSKTKAPAAVMDAQF